MLKRYSHVYFSLALLMLPAMASGQEKICLKEGEDVELSGKVIYRSIPWPESNNVSRGYVLILLKPICFDYISHGERDQAAQTLLTEAQLEPDPFVKSHLSRLIKVKGWISQSSTTWQVSNFFMSNHAEAACAIAPKDKNIAKC